MDVSAPLPEVLSLVARCVDTSVARVGSVWWLGKVGDDDRVHLVARCKRLRPDEISALLGSAGGNASVTEDGLVVMIDRAEVVRRISSIIEAVNLTESESFAVQFWIVSASTDRLQELGVDLVPAAGISLGVAAGDAIGIASATGAAFQLDAVLQAAARRRGVSVLADPTILVEDGRTATLERVEKIPVRLSFSSSNDGQVVRQDSIQTYDIGLRVEVSARAVAAESVRLKGKLSVSEMTGDREGIPVLRSEAADVAASMLLNQPALVASIERERKANVLNHAWRVGKRSEAERSVLQIWACVVRADVPVIVPAAECQDPAE